MTSNYIIGAGETGLPLTTDDLTNNGFDAWSPLTALEYHEVGAINSAFVKCYSINAFPTLMPGDVQRTTDILDANNNPNNFNFIQPTIEPFTFTPNFTGTVEIGFCCITGKNESYSSEYDGYYDAECGEIVIKVINCTSGTTYPFDFSSDFTNISYINGTNWGHRAYIVSDDTDPAILSLNRFHVKIDNTVTNATEILEEQGSVHFFVRLCSPKTDATNTNPRSLLPDNANITVHSAVGGIPISLSGSREMTVNCFHKETKIPTPEGFKDICNLKRGDIINTIDGPKPLARLMKNVISNPKQTFVKFPKNCFGNNTPLSDIYVTPPHPLVFDFKLVPAQAFVGKVPGVELVQSCTNPYNLMFEEQTYVQIEGLFFVSHHPHHPSQTLEKHEYFNPLKFRPGIFYEEVTTFEDVFGESKM